MFVCLFICFGKKSIFSLDEIYPLGTTYIKKIQEPLTQVANLLGVLGLNTVIGNEDLDEENIFPALNHNLEISNLNLYCFILKLN